MEEKKALLYDVNEAPSKREIGKWLVLAIQHILAMFVACITVPMIVYGDYLASDGTSLAGKMLAPTLVAAGIGTIVYLIITKMKSPVVLSSSFAYMTAMQAAIAPGAAGGKPNLWILPIGMAMVGLVYIIIAIVIKWRGVGWLNKLLPTIVMGPVIMVIGLGLAGSAVNNLANTAVSSANYNLAMIASGLVAMVVTALCSHYGKKTLSLIPFVIGMLAGYATASLFTIFGYYIGGNDYFHVVNWDPIVNNWKEVTVNSFFSLPDFLFLGKESAEFNAAGIGQAALIFIPVSLVTVCEHIGDHKNLSGVIGHDLLTDPGLSRTMIGDGVATAVSGILCGAANTTYGENVAVVGVTKVASTKVILLAALITIAMAFFSPLMTIAQTIPSCVTGGVSLILYGFIASSGIKLIIKDKIDMSNNRNIIIASVILVSGIGGLVISFAIGQTNISITSTAVSMILGIIMNLILKEKKEAE